MRYCDPDRETGIHKSGLAGVVDLRMGRNNLDRTAIGSEQRVVVFQAFAERPGYRAGVGGIEFEAAIVERPPHLVALRPGTVPSVYGPLKERSRDCDVGWTAALANIDAVAGRCDWWDDQHPSGEDSDADSD